MCRLTDCLPIRACYDRMVRDWSDVEYRGRLAVQLYSAQLIQARARGNAARKRYRKLHRKRRGRQAALSSPSIARSSQQMETPRVTTPPEYKQQYEQQQREQQQQYEHSATDKSQLRDGECPICHCELHQVPIMSCGHIMCKSCLHELLESDFEGTLCPICRPT